MQWNDGMINDHHKPLRKLAFSRKFIEHDLNHRYTRVRIWRQIWILKPPEHASNQKTDSKKPSLANLHDILGIKSCMSRDVFYTFLDRF